LEGREYYTSYTQTLQQFHHARPTNAKKEKEKKKQQAAATAAAAWAAFL